MSAVLDQERFQRQPSQGVTPAPGVALAPVATQVAPLMAGAEPDPSFPAPAAARDLVCLLTDGTLLVVTGKRLDPAVQEYEAELRGKGRRYQVRHVELSEIRDAHSSKGTGGTDGAGATWSAEQREVVNVIRMAIRMGASDVHFIAGREIGSIRFRVNGLLMSPPGGERTVQEVKQLIATIYRSMAEGAAGEYNEAKPQDARIREAFLAGSGCDNVRCATRPRDRGLVLIARLQYNAGIPLTLDALGYLPEQRIILDRLIRRKIGINILSGATGSGKTTTLATVYDMQVKHFGGKMHILTIEDPTEIHVHGVNHTPVNRLDDGNPDWEGSIKNSLRLDPDIVGIGEMRDGPSAVAGFRAAMTGHGVWTTLHANCAMSNLQRLQDMGVEPALLTDPSLVTGLINQSLAPTLCPHCAVPWGERPHGYDEALAAQVETLCDTTNVRVARGCERCRGTGAMGRTVIAEVCETNAAFMEAFSTGGKNAARRHFVASGGITRTEHMLRRIEQGVIDPAAGMIAVGDLDNDVRTLGLTRKRGGGAA